ncbi:hypothetical protein BCR43DRAFT_518733 [Syncephalastrum racemosum]|uniref:F-box domain-containing protein n=1 Tax=Syncephalastrum racemosum TaxID=13706 RepID=A0A1X2H1T8_SYNRA|nr:hypothetical protein BCR43DRAFT_518733 [Syncephalastrum racemosum]
MKNVLALTRLERLPLEIIMIILLQLSLLDFYELRRTSPFFLHLLDSDDQGQYLHHGVAFRYYLPAPSPFSYQRIFRILAGRHCQVCGGSANLGGLRQYWVLGALCCNTCIIRCTTTLAALTPEQMQAVQQLNIPTQDLYRAAMHRFRRRNPFGPVGPVNRVVWSRHLTEGYLPDATQEERDSRNRQLQVLDSAMRTRMRHDTRFGLLGKRQWDQHHPPADWGRLQPIPIRRQPPPQRGRGQSRRGQSGSGQRGQQ